MGFQCLAHFTTSKNSEVRHLPDPQHLYLPWFFVNIVIFNLLLPYRLGCLALPNIFRKICFCNFTSDDTQKNSSDHALSQLAIRDALVSEPVWSLPYKMDLPLFSLWLWVVFATLTHFDHLAWSNSVRCDAPFTMMALRTHIGTCSIYLSANGKSKEPLCLGSMCRA